MISQLTGDRRDWLEDDKNSDSFDEYFDDDIINASSDGAANMFAVVNIALFKIIKLYQSECFYFDSAKIRHKKDNLTQYLLNLLLMK